MPSRYPLLLLLVVSLLLGACAASRPQVTYLTDARYPPSVTVERLRDIPARPHEAIADLSWYTSSNETLRETQARLAETARQLGADAVIFDKRRYRGAKQGNDMSGVMGEYYSLNATAIRWLDR